MRFLVLTALLGCVLADTPLITMYKRYAGPENNMTLAQCLIAWKHFDINDDKIITKREFDHVWTTLNLPEKTNVAADFELIDTNHDAQLSEEDLTYLCKLFDENGDGVITQSEWSYNFAGLFERN
ncbi:uncharacterized protein LOC112555941 [Pomacea canaliculata]|uniref:uncharacterized protein LOC112555941 n=1 Tax=Pomacea canaliculata TaxID=400727 RepID=UPI000D731FAE|nr:uncharacterized protein LOC112555941 [Pomacea canaliculata]